MTDFSPKATELAIREAYENWKPISTAPDDELVMTKIDDGFGVRCISAMTKINKLWFPSGCDVYVYYTPTHWKEI